MQVTTRLRRSVLYTPGSNSRALTKAVQLDADCVIFDLEDAVAPEAKPQARDHIQAVLANRPTYHPEIAIRINALGSPWGEADLSMVAQSNADAIVIPKAESAAQIASIDALMRDQGNTTTPIWAMSETPKGIMKLAEIAAHPRVAVIVMGTSDLAKDLRVPMLGDRAGLSYALGAAVLAARAHGLDIIDGVHLVLDDPDGLRAACAQGRDLGFDGKSLIHPRQIDAANETFGVTEAAANQAEEIVAAWQSASGANAGVIVVRGQLIEQLHVDAAHRILDLRAQMLARAAAGHDDKTKNYET